MMKIVKMNKKQVGIFKKQASAAGAHYRFLNVAYEFPMHSSTPHFVCR
jgi:hypothetical protein